MFEKSEAVLDEWSSTFMGNRVPKKADSNSELEPNRIEKSNNSDDCNLQKGAPLYLFFR